MQEIVPDSRQGLTERSGHRLCNFGDSPDDHGLVVRLYPNQLMFPGEGLAVGSLKCVPIVIQIRSHSRFRLPVIATTVVVRPSTM